MRYGKKLEALLANQPGPTQDLIREVLDVIVREHSTSITDLKKKVIKLERRIEELEIR
jgi:hypothetical protein